MNVRIFYLLFVLLFCGKFILSETGINVIYKSTPRLIYISDAAEGEKSAGSLPRKHTSHEKIYSEHAPDYNRIILKAIDKIQGQAITGGGYYTNLNDKSKESPIGYPLKIFNYPLIKPPRTTSYCTGATFAAFIEALNLIYPHGHTRLTLDRYEALRMQEMNGTRREDFVKVWGNWNTQWGAQYVMIKYLEMGKIVSQREARPGDFINILFKGGGGHSAIFLGWYKNENKETQLLYWSSQPETNGISDHSVPAGKISKLVIVRLTNPGKIFSFDVSNPHSNLKR
jgi:hypothetical protein